MKKIYWNLTSLQDLIETNVDYRGRTPPKSPTGIPVLTAANVKNGRIDLSSISYISPETYERETTRGFPKENDVLITTEAPIGEVASFPGNKKYHISRRLIALRGDSKKVDSIYLKYALLSKFVNDQVEAVRRGSTVPRILKEDIFQLEIPCPPMESQKFIANLLGSLDDKIELNRRMNETLEAMAQALFRSWFVDFDPVRAKMAGREPEGMDAETAALFPDEMEVVDGREVPKGWRVGTIGDLLEISKDSINPQDQPYDSFYHYSIPAFDNNRTPIFELGSEIKSNKFIIPENSVLISKLNPMTPRIWCIHETREDDVKRICSTEFIVCKPKKKCSKEIIHSILNSAEFSTELISRVTGTSGSHQRVRPSSFLSIKIILPAENVMKLFEETIFSLLKLVFENDEQSRTLAALRDTLLPKLISGKIRVPVEGK